MMNHGEQVQVISWLGDCMKVLVELMADVRRSRIAKVCMLHGCDIYCIIFGKCRWLILINREALTNGYDILYFISSHYYMHGNIVYCYCCP